MKVLNVVYSFPPDPPGGTEIYVEQLSRHLKSLGVASIVAAPGRLDEEYEWQGLAVRRFAADAGSVDLERLYGAGDGQAAASFARILDREKPDLVHQHALTPACSVDLVREAKRRGLPVAFTYHTPTVSCQRGTLLEWGAGRCDGRLDVSRCAGCTLHGLGVPRPLAAGLARVPQAAGRKLGQAGLAGGAWTALRMSSLLRRRHDSLRALFALVDCLVALSPWVEDVLRLNGVPDGRIVRSPHGISLNGLPSSFAARPAAGPLRLAHLGRADPVKGTGVLIAALRKLPEAPIELDVWGVVQDEDGAGVLRQLQAAAGNDPRVRFIAAVDHGDVVARLAGYDMLVAPSQGMETGPLVVLEAFAAGVPVLGSALGGIADKVRDGIDGILVSPHASTDAWAAALARCASERSLVARLRAGVQPPRSMTDVAGEMRALYDALVRTCGWPAAIPASATAGPGLQHL